MTRRIRGAIGAACLVLLVVFAWRAGTPHRVPGDDEGASRIVPSSRSVLLPDAEGARRAPLPAVAPRAPRSFVALRTDAEAGDVGAQIDLGVWLARCITQGEPGYADTIVRQYEATAASGLPGTQWRGALLDQQRTVRDRLLLEHADCVLLAESGIEPSHVWLERAARSGDIEAKVAYAARALDEFVRVDADVAGGTVHYLDNLEEIVRRRDLGRRWLADALRAGSVDALQLLARAYAGDHPLYPPDPRQAAIHRHALALAQARLSGDAAQLRSVWHGGPQGIADEGLGPADRPAIDAAARRIYLQWFGPDPEEG